MQGAPQKTASHSTLKQLNKRQFLIRKAIDGIDPVFATVIIAEIGDINAFHSSDALTKYAGLTWLKNQSGDFVFLGEDTSFMSAKNYIYCF